MNRVHIYWLVALLVAALSSSCSDEEKMEILQEDNKTIVFSLDAPDEDEEAQVSVPSTMRRAKLEEKDTRSFTVVWSVGEKVTLFFEHNNKFYMSTGKVISTTNMGKTAQFSAPLPEEINVYGSYRVWGICGKDGNVIGNAPYFYASMFRSTPSSFSAPVWFSTTINGTWPKTIKCNHLGAYEILHLKNKSNNTIKVNFDGFNCTTPWYIEYGAYKPLTDATVTGEATVPMEDFRNANDTYCEIPANTSASFYSWYIPSGTKMKSAKLKMTIDKKEVLSSNTKTSSLTLKKGSAYHLYAVWDGSKLTQGLDAYTDPLRLSSTNVTMPLEGKSSVDILSGNGSYSASTSNANIAEPFVKGSIVYIYSKYTGTCDITVTDIFTSKSQVIKVNVVNSSATLYGRIMQDMILVEPGEFIMGDPNSQYENASPAHKVIITKPFFISKYEVTNKIYEQVMYDTPEEEIYKPDYAVESIMRYQLVGFINKLQEKTKKLFRLPTNAEWEYAARGGKYSKGYVYAGSNDIKEVRRDSWNAPVGTKRPNELGIYDMSGGMVEWVQDNPYDYPSQPETDPLHYDPDQSSWIVRWSGNSSGTYSERIWVWYGYGGWASCRSDFGIRIVLPYDDF